MKAFCLFLHCALCIPGETHQQPFPSEASRRSMQGLCVNYPYLVQTCTCFMGIVTDLGLKSINPGPPQVLQPQGTAGGLEISIGASDEEEGEGDIEIGQPEINALADDMASTTPQEAIRSNSILPLPYVPQPPTGLRTNPPGPPRRRNERGQVDKGLLRRYDAVLDILSKADNEECTLDNLGRELITRRVFQAGGRLKVFLEDNMPRTVRVEFDRGTWYACKV